MIFEKVSRDCGLFVNEQPQFTQEVLDWLDTSGIKRAEIMPFGAAEPFDIVFDKECDRVIFRLRWF